MGEQVRELFNWARRRKILAAVFVAFTLTVGILIGSVVSGRVSAMKGLGFPGTTATALAVPDPIPSSSSFASIVNRVEPAVVNIATTQVLERKKGPRTRRAQPNDQQDDPMQDFFDRFFDGRQDGPPQAERSLGSGVIVDKRGYILTNNHVVEQATKIQVQLNGDTTRYTAKLVGVDQETDLAVIKIDANKELPIAKLGNSDGVQVGDWVLAIGSPFGLQATVTAGIISAKDRGGIGNRQFQRFLQTDAAINPGNSGGPLLDSAGRLIGVNTAIFSPSGSNSGIGFAVPVDTVNRIVPQLIRQGEITRAGLGVRIGDDRVARRLNLPGVLIIEVDKGSAAEAAGLRSTRVDAKGGVKLGDVIVAIDGERIETSNELFNAMEKRAVGETVKVTVLRGETRLSMAVTLQAVR